MNPPLALVTGATGFVGRHLVNRLHAEGWRVRAALRRPLAGPWDEACIIGDLDRDSPCWLDACVGVDCVFHLAARVHVLNDKSADPDAAYRRINVEATAALLQAAQACSVKRFAYISTIKVLGEASAPGQALAESFPPAPSDAYARSKLAAECLVLKAKPLEAFILRPPLVYGPGVGANFARMLRWVRSGMWLPFGAVSNRRSLVFVGNLVDALVFLAAAPGVGGRIFHVSDGDAVSTPELLSAIARACQRKPRLLNIPVPVLKSLLCLLGKRAEAQRLCASLQIGDTVLRREFGWNPPHDFAQSLELSCTGQENPTYSAPNSTASSSSSD
jgi:UDP-glucose 4-epimerase